ncbi:MAG: hypothetical protein FWG26_01525 [Betaproteobacteria bacterium]|nr:hypothetical protein [Betaproteobacteria bacterium]
MSYFILYFEEHSKNKSSYGEYNVPSIYSIDNEITEGKIFVQYNGVSVNANIISSRMDASLFYVFQKPTKMVETAQRIRSKLYEFIRSRIDLKVVPYLFVLFLRGDWPEKIRVSEKPVEVLLSNMDEFFREGPKVGLFKIVKGLRKQTCL